MSDANRRRTRRSVAWSHRKPKRGLLALTVVCLGVAAVSSTESGTPTAHQFTGAAHQFIVQGGSSAVAAAEVAAAHGVTLSDLPIVHGVVAKLTAGEASVVRGDGLRVSPNLQVMVEGTGLPAGSHPSGVFTSVTGAKSMWANGINGSGVTVAVLDTGIDANLPDLASRVVDGVNLANPRNPNGWATDTYGHGTFVAGLIASNGQSSGGTYSGVAPGADLVSLKVAGSSGLTNESTVIEGVSWAIANQASDGIQVLNLSLGVEPTSPSALDPLDQAVEAAWNAGIVVVTSAGNAGPDNGSITSPGNDPLVITAGAMDDGAADVAATFSVPSFSSVGPTSIDGWFKPDLVAPGRSVVSVMPPNSTISYENPQARIGRYNFVGSGTSFSAAIVSGLVALLLQANPGLTPDQVKAALLYGASPGPVGSPLVDGHGVADVMTANADAGNVFLDQGPAAAAESTSPGATVSLSSTWAASTWNPANWSGPAWDASPFGASLPTSSALTATASAGLSWLGAAWNGAAWNGAAWNAQTWEGAAWNGAAWNGAAWNGAAWNGAAWNGAAWNGAAWNDETWG